MDKKLLSEGDICTKFITPALRRAGWGETTQLREEVSFTKGRIIVRGKLVTRGKAKRADYILDYKPNIPLGVIEASQLRELLTVRIYNMQLPGARPRARRLMTQASRSAFVGCSCASVASPCRYVRTVRGDQLRR